MNDSATSPLPDDGFDELRKLDRSLATIRAGLEDIAVIAEPGVAERALAVIGDIDAFSPTVVVSGRDGARRKLVLSALSGNPCPGDRGTGERGPGDATVVPFRFGRGGALPKRLILREATMGDDSANLHVLVLRAEEETGPDLAQRIGAFGPAATVVFVDGQDAGTVAAALARIEAAAGKSCPVLPGSVVTGAGIPGLRAAISRQLSRNVGQALLDSVLARTKQILKLMESPQPMAAPAMLPPSAAGAVPEPLAAADREADLQRLGKAAGQALDAAIAQLRIELDLRMDRRRAGFTALGRRRLGSWIAERGAEADWACSTSELRLQMRATYLWYSKELLRAARKIAGNLARQVEEDGIAEVGAAASFSPSRIRLPAGLGAPLVNSAQAAGRKSFLQFGLRRTKTGGQEQRLDDLEQAIGELIGGLRTETEPSFEDGVRTDLTRYVASLCPAAEEGLARPLVLGMGMQA